MKNVYKFADVNFEIEYNYPVTGRFLGEYISNSQPECFISISADAIEREYQKTKEFPMAYYECLVILKEVNNALTKYYNGLVFHCSCVLYQGKAYAFTAHSGVGKSTHTAILKENYPEIDYVNDDKPFIRYFEKENKFYAYGNPWKGKHGRGNNVRAELAGICFLSRDKENYIERVSAKSVLPLFLEQIVYPEDLNTADKVLTLTDKLFSSVKLYKLKCNKDLSAGQVSFNGMIKN